MAVEFLDIKPNTDEWLKYRIDSGIGASQLGTVMGLNEYECPLELFHSKIGLLKPKEKSIRMTLGSMSEGLISDLYEYYDEDEKVFLKNINTKTKVRHLEEVNQVAINRQFPNMYVSLDRRYKNDKGEYILVEMKNKMGMAYRKYENEISPHETMQLALQCLICEASGSIIYLIDNIRMTSFDMKYENALKLKPIILREVKEFWSRVEKGRILLSQIYNARSNYNMKLAETLTQELYKLEPSGGGQAYLDYLTELSKEKKASVCMKGNEQLLKVATDLKKLSEKKKKLIEQETKLKSELASAMRLENKVEIDFGKCGSVSLFNGRFNNKVK
jgi:hypothetical protein